MSEEEIKKMENMMAASWIPRGLNIRIRFDKELQNITHTEGFPMMISEGASFLFLLQSIFMEYPKIKKNILLEYSAFPSTAFHQEITQYSSMATPLIFLFHNKSLSTIFPLSKNPYFWLQNFVSYQT